MVLIWEMSFWTQLAPSRRSVCVKYIISFFFWIKKKKCFPCVWFLVGIYISVLTLETCKVHWQDSYTWRAARLWALAEALIQFILHWINSGLFCLYFTHFSPVPPYPFSSITPSCLDSRSSPPLAWGFLWNVWNDSKEIFQIINKISVIRTAMHLKLFFSVTIKMLLYA